MIRPRFFGMVSTAVSSRYTGYALQSFIEHTDLQPRDRFFLIANDHHKVEIPSELQPHTEAILRDAPCSFAENINSCIEQALQGGSDLYFLNNDLIFSSQWAELLAVNLPVITLPLCNQDIPYQTNGLSLSPQMKLEKYLGHENMFQKIVAAHQRKHENSSSLDFCPPFFCVRIPLEVIRTVGLFDTSFGMGGAEDNDYAIRTYLKGLAIMRCEKAFLLHFGGKSTWQGGETQIQRQKREEQYLKRFREKWGEELTNLAVFGEGEKKENWHEAIIDICSKNGRDITPYKAPLVTVGAVYVLCDNERWLQASYHSIYNSVQKIIFLVADSPWNGEKRDNRELLTSIKTLPDPENKISVKHGTWSNETEQRNAGLAFLRELGLEYCMIVDADEVYHDHELSNAIQHISSFRFIPAWRIHCYTYWKSPKYRVDPPEPFAPVVFMRTEALSFRDKREPDTSHTQLLPQKLIHCHHLSYARTDEELLRKLETFSHSHEIVDNWYEAVWKEWDTNPSLQNLHPCWPGNYKNTVEVQEESLPEALQRYCNKELKSDFS